MKDRTPMSMETPPMKPTFQERLQAAQEVWPHLKPPWHPHLPNREEPISEASALADSSLRGRKGLFP